MTSAAASGRIGPNAVTQLAAALLSVEGERRQHQTFAAAGLEGRLNRPPAEMVDEAEIARLHLALHAVVGDARARTLGWIAGRRTADYLLARRIPRPAQGFIRALPRPLAAFALSRAVSRHAWTFAGSGTLRVLSPLGAVVRFEIHACPLCRGAQSDQPWCDFYAGVFERLFGVLVDPAIRVREVACAAEGAPACVFRIAGDGRGRRREAIALARGSVRVGQGEARTA